MQDRRVLHIFGDCHIPLTAAMTDSAVESSQQSRDLPWDVANLDAKTGAPTKEQLAEYLKSHATLAFLTKHKLQGALKSVLKNRKLKELHSAYEEFAETTPFATDEERAAEQAAVDEAAALAVATKGAKKAAAPAAAPALPAATDGGGDDSAAVTAGDGGSEGGDGAEGGEGGEGAAGDGGEGGSKKKNRKKKKKGGAAGGGVNSAVLPGGNGKVGTTPAPSLRLSGFTDS